MRHHSQTTDLFDSISSYALTTIAACTIKFRIESDEQRTRCMSTHQLYQTEVSKNEQATLAYGVGANNEDPFERHIKHGCRDINHVMTHIGRSRYQEISSLFHEHESALKKSAFKIMPNSQPVISYATRQI